jgi:hypothetical protein
MHGADHIVEFTEESAPHDRKDESTQKRSDEAFDSFFRRELDKGCTAHGNATDIREYIIADDERRGDPEPDQTFENIIHDKVAEITDQKAIRRSHFLVRTWRRQ